jgi:hypothetical protein
MIYVIMDFGYLYWVVHWYFKLPAPLNLNVPMALLGLGTRLREGFGNAPKLAKQAPPSQSRGEGFSFSGKKTTVPKMP